MCGTLPKCAGLLYSVPFRHGGSRFVALLQRHSSIAVVISKHAEAATAGRIHPVATLLLVGAGTMCLVLTGGRNVTRFTINRGVAILHRCPIPQPLVQIKLGLLTVQLFLCHLRKRAVWSVSLCHGRRYNVMRNAEVPFAGCPPQHTLPYFDTCLVERERKVRFPPHVARRFCCFVGAIFA